jgi:hypothetical protein
MEVPKMKIIQSFSQQKLLQLNGSLVTNLTAIKFLLGYYEYGSASEMLLERDLEEM